MTDKEKIKEEIERLDEKYRTLRVEGTIQQAKEADLVVHVLLQISNFIDSLPEEPDCEKKDYCERYEKLTQSDTFKSSYCDKSLGKEESTDEANCTTKSDDLEEAAKHYLYGAILYDDVYVGNPTEDDCIRCFKAGAEWQKEKDYKMYAHVPLKDIHDAWQELKKNKSDIENYPSVCFQKGADWKENQMKEALQTEYEKGRFDMREEMMKDAIECVVEDWCGDYPEITIPLNPQDFKTDDRVKIIICKPEQQ